MPRLDDDPEPLNPKLLGALSADFVRVADLIKEAAYQVQVRHISRFPIIVLCKVAQPIGQLLVAGAQADTDYNYYLSFAEEFIQRGLLADEGVAIFEEHYKPADEFACLFVVDEALTNFVFIPYPQEEGDVEPTSPLPGPDEEGDGWGMDEVE